jgi:putative nucleotide binding protein
MHEFEQKRDDLEEYGVVLDFLPTGKSFSVRSEPIVQILGETRFTLLEAVPKVQGIKIAERIYIGKGERDKISLIKSRLTYQNLTEVAKNELPNAIISIIKNNEKKFVGFFNTASPINIRMHSLELLPGIGKKHLTSLLEAREDKPFESFEDMIERVQLLQDPIKLLTDRILVELKGETRFYILTRPPAQPRRQ